MKVLTYRYCWKTTGSESVNFKIVSDVPAGLESFEKRLLLLPDVTKVSREYLHEYDVSLVGSFEVLFDSDLAAKEVLK